MSQLLETICYQNGKLRHIEYHQERLERSCKHFGLIPLSLQDVIQPFLSEPSDQKIKVRVLYGDGKPEISTSSYLPLTNKTLKMIEADIDYDYKLVDRATLNHLYAQRGTSDNILIIKNGHITDTAYTNVVLFDGSDWVTPDIPLLKGTMRQALLDEGRIIERKIMREDLPGYEKICLINAMLSLDDMVEVEELL